MAFNSVKNYYELLEIDTGATTEQIKSAYRKLARKYHPDVNKDPNAVEIFKRLTQAYETLSDETERKKYDILNGIFAKPQNNFSTYKNNNKTNPQTTSYSNKTSETTKKENTSQNSKNTTFKQQNKTKPQKKTNSFIKKVKYFIVKFKKNKNLKNSTKPQKGKDIITDITVTPEEIFTGTKRVINVRTTTACPKCGGHKFTNGDKCPLCQGKGSITETKKITLTIPKGIKDGTKLCLKGEGGCGKNGGACGNIYVIVRIETKSKVHFNKLDIHYNIPITPFEAALGDEISIPAFDGTIKLKLPPNTCSGQKFRIAKQGLKRHGKIGDLIVTVNIEFSHNLSDDEIKLYEQLKNLSTDNLRKNLKYGS